MKLSSWSALTLVVLLLTGCGKSPESTVKSFYQAIAEGEITEAKGYVSAQLLGIFGQEKISAELSRETERIRACGGIKKVEVKLQGNGEVRSGTVTFTYGGECPPKTQATKLVQEDARWKITANK